MVPMTITPKTPKTPKTVISDPESPRAPFRGRGTAGKNGDSQEEAEMKQEQYRYLVLELETGYMDGWYMGAKAAEGMTKAWDEKRPRFTHVLMARAAKDTPHFPNSLHLPRIHHEELRMKRATHEH